MNVKQIYQLQQGTKVHHQHYGLCTVDGVIRGYGPLLLPDTKIGQTLISQASRMPLGTPVVEPLFHLLTQVSLLTSVLLTDIPNPLTGTMPRF